MYYRELNLKAVEILKVGQQMIDHGSKGGKLMLIKKQKFNFVHWMDVRRSRKLIVYISVL